MKKILLVVFLFFTLGMQSQEKYAVLIVGDYAAKLSDIPTEALWNGGEDLKAPMMEFWNDTYLMWELLKSKGYTDENIFILFADGNDFKSSSPRYTPPMGVKLTDYAANRENVVNLFGNLYNGTDGLPKISEDDFLFVWTFGHGNNDNNGVYSLCLVDGFLQDSIFSPLVNAIPANRKAVWMQQCCSYNDSLFASIDLEYVYQRFGIRGSNDWQNSTDLLLSALPHNKHYNSSETSWTEIVTSQPEGFVVNQDGNVTITNGEGLAWMISTVNGLNGQESNDYKDVVITLENDIYISGNAWVAIGTQENPFRGTLDGQGFSVQGIDMYDAYEGRNFGLFGYLDNAVIKNVTLGKGQIVGYEDCGGIAYKADNNTLIDRCVVRTEMSFCNNSGGIVGINKDSRISNCALIPESFEGAMMCVGGIAGQNVSAESDAIIENCFVSTEYVSSYSTSYAGGIVGKNITENEGHSAIIRNCYAAPLKMYGHSGGVAAYNSKNSVIENSYYTISYGSNDYILCEENEGEITNSTLFNEELLLEENVEVYGEGVGELLVALNKWVENSQGQYNSWCILEDENYGYPILEFMAKDFANTEELTINSMVIYPNPAHEYIKIESEKKSEIKVYSVNGQIVLKRNINEGVSTIDISNLNSGMYFIEVDGTISKLVVR